MTRMYTFIGLAGMATLLAVAVRGEPPAPVLPAWVHEVGAKRAPTGGRVFAVQDYGAKADGETTATAAIQRAIDAAAEAGGGVVTFAPGVYVTGALFVKSNVHLRVDDGVTLLGIPEEAAYPKRYTRVAGIEMEWPAALINVYEAENVKISGGGKIDGNGQWCWDKYWRMRREVYEPLGLRWAVDYDAERVRLVVVWQSSDVTLEDLKLRRSGFWTVHVCYSERVTVDGMHIRDNQGPSTDGVNIDSSSHVLVQNCDIDNNDDDICLKAGRDWDGLRVNRPCEYVFIRDNVTRRGGGIVSFGSETSGGIRHIVAYRNTGLGTKEGLRFKSAKTRGGYVSDVLILDTKMVDVPLPFTFTLNWNPSYSYASMPVPGAKLPPNLDGKIPDYWRTMNTPVEPPERGIAQFRDITIAGVEIVGAREVFMAAGLPEKPLRNVRFENVVARGEKAGAIEYARDWEMKNVTVITPAGEPVAVRESVGVGEVTVKKADRE